MQLGGSSSVGRSEVQHGMQLSLFLALAAIRKRGPGLGQTVKERESATLAVECGAAGFFV